MPYRAVLASISPSAIDRYREGSPLAPLHASLVEECPHDLTATDIQPLGSVLAEAIDLGQPLRNDGWHPLRPPVVVDPETVIGRSMQLEQAWRDAEPELGGMMAEMLGPDIESVRRVYAHAAAQGEMVLTFLSAPDDPAKAERSLIPDIVLDE